MTRVPVHLEGNRQGSQWQVPPLSPPSDFPPWLACHDDSKVASAALGLGLWGELTSLKVGGRGTREANTR